MKADSTSHLVRQRVNFELFLFLYLVCALLLQKINIYKTNYHRVDLNLVIFVVVILGRRLAWYIFQEVQSPRKPKSTMKPSSWQAFKSRSSKGGNGIFGPGWEVWSNNIKKSIVVLCTVPVVLWSVIHLVQNTSLFNLLFLFYPLLLYLSLFGFTLEPRCYRERYKSPCTFLQHINFSSPSRQSSSSPISSSSLPKKMDQDLSNQSSASHSMANSSSLHSGIHNRKSGSNNPSVHQNGPSSLHFRHNDQPDMSTKFTNHIVTNIGKVHSSQIVHNHVKLQDRSPSGSRSTGTVVGLKLGKETIKYSPEYSFLLPSTPDEVRDEVELLLSDLVVRLKQLLFNSLLCAYYVGFIPMQFADSHLYYDKWWCIEHAFLVWANSFVIISSHLLPPSYCNILYQCCLHLGCWTRCTHDETAQIWSPDVVWLHGMIVQWNGESFRAEGPQNVAIPCVSSQECFYLLFHSRLHVHAWLLTMQCITVAFQIVVLLRSVFWFQTFSLSVFLVFNYFILYKLLYNLLWYRRCITLP